MYICIHVFVCAFVCKHILVVCGAQAKLLELRAWNMEHEVKKSANATT